MTYSLSLVARQIKRLMFLFVFLMSGICASAQTLVWERPMAPYSPRQHNFTTVRVELGDGQTDVTFRFQNIPSGEQVWLDKGSLLRADGKEYKAIAAKDRTLGDRWAMPESRQLDVTVSFEALPKDVASFDFVMGRHFTVAGIHDGNQHREGIADSYWRNNQTGEWLVGFGRQHVIYGSRTWDITSQTTKGDRYQLIAQSGTDRLSVALDREKNGQRKVTIIQLNAQGKSKAKQTALCSRIITEALPDYPTADTASLANNHYRQGDSVTIRGWLKDMPEQLRAQDNSFSISTYSMFGGSGDAVHYSAPLDSLGRFTLRMPVENTCGVFADHGRSYLPLVLEPGETYYVMFDFANNQKLVMGQHARLMNEIFQLRPSMNLPSRLSELKQLGAEQYLAKCDSVLQQAQQQVDDMAMKHRLSTRWQQFWHNSQLAEMAGVLLQCQYELGQLPDNYADYAERAMQQLMEPYSLYGSKFNYMQRDYVQWLMQKQPGGSIPDRIEMVLEDAARDRMLDYTDELRRCVKDYRPLLENLESSLSTAPAEQRDSLIQQFNSHPIVLRLNEVFGLPQMQQRFIETQQYQEASHLRNMLKERGWSQTFIDCSTANSLTRQLDGTRTPLSRRSLAIAESIQHPAAREAVLSMHHKYEALSKEIVDVSSLRTNDAVKDMSEGGQIFQKLVEPFRGKLVLVDVWGTWCQPCLMALKSSQEEYERLKPYDMVFLYLANRSDDEGWKNVIKEYNVQGPNVVHYNLPAAQQSAVEHYLNVSSFPTYKLVDQEGHVLDIPVDAHHVDKLEEVVKKLTKK